MYEVIYQTITEGGFDLPFMLGKIDRLWLEGSIDATERDSLKEYARERAVPEDSYASVEQRVLSVEKALRELEARVAAVEAAGAASGGEGGEGSDSPATYPEWVQPTGAHDAYGLGDRVTFGGRVYESAMAGNVWSPSAYPAGWKEITSEDISEE